MGLQFCVGSLASARHANPCGGEGGEEGLARGGKGGGRAEGLGPQPTAALVLQPDSRSALAAGKNCKM